MLTTPHTNSTLDATRLETVLELLEGNVSPAEAAQRHGVSVEEVEAWRSLYLSAARHASGSLKAPRRFARWAVPVSGALVAAVVLVAATARSQQAVVCATAGWPSLLFCFEPNQPARAGELNGNFKQVADWNVPVGGIVAWHKNVNTTALTLPSAWRECSGQVVSDAESPLNGRTLPDLNGGARFLRGAATSGTMQADAFQGHKHTLNSGRRIDLLDYVHPNGSYELYSAAQSPGCGGSCGLGYYDVYKIIAPDLGDPVETGNGTPRLASETRPLNMSVVWIIRIK